MISLRIKTSTISFTLSLLLNAYSEIADNISIELTKSNVIKLHGSFHLILHF